MAYAQLALEYLRVLLSWPPVVLGLGLFFMLKQSGPIAILIGRIAAIKLPGGSELLMPQATKNAQDVKALPVADAGAGTPDIAADRLRSEQERSTLWEFRFLNYFLVPATQFVLGFLADRKPITYATYDSWTLAIIQNPVERRAILEALGNHHLIAIDGDLITVTTKGRAYLSWRGPLDKYLELMRPVPPLSAPPSLPGPDTEGPV